MSLSTATCEVLKVCGPLLEQHRDQIGLTFYRWPHIYQYLSIIYSYLFISIHIYNVSRKLFSAHPELRNTFNMSHQRPPTDTGQLL